MKKTNKELLQFFGLKVGDKIKVDGYHYPFVICEENSKIFAKRENSLSCWDYYDIGKLTNVLLIHDYEIIKPKKKLADIKMSLHDIISRIKLVDNEVLPHSEKREIIDELYDIENILAFNEKEMSKKEKANE